MECPFKAAHRESRTDEKSVQTLQCRVGLLVILPDRDQKYHQKGENHLHVGQRVHPKRAQDDQLDHLHPREVVDVPLRHAANVVGGRIGGLDRDDVFKMLFPVPLAVTVLKV